MKIVDLARLRTIYHCLTDVQRQYLTSIVAGGPHPLNTPVIEDLIRLGLARRRGDWVVATEEGRYVASLF